MRAERSGTGALRMLGRMAHIWLVLLRHGVAVVWAGLARQGRTAWPVRLRRCLEDLGVGFVKLGQLLSARADLLGEPYRRELVHLRDDVAPVPLAAVMAEVEASVGVPVATAFASFDPVPVAAASVSQVHRATLAGGRAVAVKVRRAGVVPRSRADIAWLVLTARVAERVSRRARLLGLVGMATELGTMIRQELDFVAERANAIAIAEVFADDPSVVVPSIVTELSGPSVIVMDFIEGVSLGDRAGLVAAGYSLPHYAASVIRANVAMVLGPSLFHADLHPGNLLALPEGRLALLDFGAAGSATSPTLTAAVRPIVDALATGDAGEFADGVLLMTSHDHPVDRALLAKELDQLVLAPLSDASLGALNVGQLLKDMVGVLRHHGLSVNPDITLLLRAVMTCESTAQELDPHVSFRRVVVPFLVDRAFGWPAPVAGFRDPEPDPDPEVSEEVGPQP